MCVCAQSCLALLPPHGLKPTRLLCPWNFPGKLLFHYKNLGVGCHFLLQRIFQPRDQTHLLHLLLWQVDSLPLSHLGSSFAIYTQQMFYKIFQRICMSVKSLKPVIVQSLSGVLLFATPWATACQASPSLTISQSLPKFMSWVSQLSNHIILCCPLLLLPLVFPSSRVFSSDQVDKVLGLQLQHQSFQWIFRVDFL